MLFFLKKFFISTQALDIRVFLHIHHAYHTTSDARTPMHHPSGIQQAPLARVITQERMPWQQPPLKRVPPKISSINASPTHHTKCPITKPLPQKNTTPPKKPLPQKNPPCLKKQPYFSKNPRCNSILSIEAHKNNACRRRKSTSLTRAKRQPKSSKKTYLTESSDKVARKYMRDAQSHKNTSRILLIYRAKSRICLQSQVAHNFGDDAGFQADRVSY